MCQLLGALVAMEPRELNPKRTGRNRQLDGGPASRRISRATSWAARRAGLSRLRLLGSGLALGALPGVLVKIARAIFTALSMPAFSMIVPAMVSILSLLRSKTSPPATRCFKSL
jgi:hypothetical protein